MLNDGIEGFSTRKVFFVNMVLIVAAPLVNSFIVLLIVRHPYISSKEIGGPLSLCWSSIYGTGNICHKLHGQGYFTAGLITFLYFPIYSYYIPIHVFWKLPIFLHTGIFLYSSIFSQIWRKKICRLFFSSFTWIHRLIWLHLQDSQCWKSIFDVGCYY